MTDSKSKRISDAIRKIAGRTPKKDAQSSIPKKHQAVNDEIRRKSGRGGRANVN